MTDELRHARTETPQEMPSPPHEAPHEGEDDAPADRLVPVGESIRYRRRAQRAEARLTQLEQQLADVQAQRDGRLEELAAAEAQRDELRSRLDLAASRASAERMLRASGVTDTQTAMALLEKRTDLSEAPDDEALRQEVERLVADKPLLLADPPHLPGKTASARTAAGPARLARAANRAAASGHRRDVAEYLRLRRKQGLGDGD